MLKAHASDSKTFSQRILLIYLAEQTPLVILFNRMTDSLKLLLYSNTSNSKWILIKLTSLSDKLLYKFTSGEAVTITSDKISFLIP